MNVSPPFPAASSAWAVIRPVPTGTPDAVNVEPVSVASTPFTVTDWIGEASSTWPVTVIVSVAVEEWSWGVSIVTIGAFVSRVTGTATVVACASRSRAVTSIVFAPSTRGGAQVNVASGSGPERVPGTIAAPTRHSTVVWGSASTTLPLTWAGVTLRYSASLGDSTVSAGGCVSRTNAP
jgi:hypothetical protein